MTLTFRALGEADAEQVIAWRYLPPYDFYNLSDGDRGLLLHPENSYFAADDENARLIGFCCFGRDARVPGGSYSDDTGLDVGVGLRPDATGQGLGPGLIRGALDLAVQTYGLHRFGATVAAFNQRAVRAAERAGFQRTGVSFRASPDASGFNSRPICRERALPRFDPPPIHTCRNR